jgi:hypothetical protein
VSLDLAGSSSDQTEHPFFGLHGSWPPAFLCHKHVRTWRWASFAARFCGIQTARPRRPSSVARTDHFHRIRGIVLPVEITQIIQRHIFSSPRRSERPRGFRGLGAIVAVRNDAVVSMKSEIAENPFLPLRHDPLLICGSKRSAIRHFHRNRTNSSMVKRLRQSLSPIGSIECEQVSPNRPDRLKSTRSELYSVCTLRLDDLANHFGA